MMGLLNPTFAYIAAGALMAGIAAGWSVRDWKADADAAAAIQQANELREQARQESEAWAAKYEELRAKYDKRRGMAQRTIREVYRNVEVPSQCAAAPAAVSVLKQSLDRANAAATGKSGPALPSSASAAGASN